MRAAPFVIAGLIALALSWLWFKPDPCLSVPSAILLDQSGASRDLRPRWSGCFGATPGSSSGVPSRSTVQTRGALAQFELAARQASRLGLADFGIALTLAGESSRGISALQSVIAEQPDADGLSNLAAAHLIRAGRTRTAYDLILALEHASHAVMLDSRNASARYNEALALTQLHFDADADRAWRAYLEVDTRSAWRGQAAEFLSNRNRVVAPAATRLTQALAGSSGDVAALSVPCLEAPQVCREHLEERLLPSWGAAVADGRADEARTLLDRAALLAGALRERGDELDAAAVEDIRRTMSDSARTLEIARGVSAYGRARAAFEEEQPSVPLFEDAERRLASAGSPLAGWARAHRIYAAFAQFDSPQLDALGSQLTGWAREAVGRGYHPLAGRLYYLAALTFANRSHYVPAEPLFAASQRALERTRERDHLASTEWAMANARLRLGDPEEGWRWFLQAFETLPETPSARRRYVILFNAGLWLANSRLDHAAVRVFSSARDEALAANQPGRAAEALFNRAQAYNRLGDVQSARADLDAGRPRPGQTGAWGQSDRSRAEYLAGLAEVSARSDPAAAVAPASEALTFFEGRGFAARVAGLRLVRGRAYRLQGDADRAAADFAAGIQTYERYRRELTSDQQRIASQEVVWDLYEEQLLLSANESERALNLAEQSRARTLLDQISAGQAVPAAPTSLQRALRADQRIVYYAVLERDLLAWVIGPASTEFVRAPLDRAMLERRVQALLDTLSSGAPAADWQRLSEALFTTLIEPVRAHLPPGAALVVVPDGVLNRLPFAALRDPRRGRLLIEDHSLTMAPSATIVARTLADPRSVWTVPQRVLVAGDPQAEGVALAPLAGARREGRAIAALYPQSELLEGAAATRSALLSGLPGAEILHFGGHAISSPDYPLLAHLELAPESGVSGSSELNAVDISKLRAASTRLVVLAACRTGVGAVRRGEGILSLARPFLIAGVPSVMATLWDIDDQQSAPFFLALHKELAKGVPPARALRDVQLASLESPAALWAAFVLVGSPGLTAASPF